MPQLDIYTFPTQIYTMAFVFFFGLLYVVKFIFTAFLKIELLENEEIYTLDTIFLVRTQVYLQVFAAVDTPVTPVADNILEVLANSLVSPKTN